MSDISIIVPIYNDADSLRVLLARLAEQAELEARAHVVVVDDGSSRPLEIAGGRSDGLPVTIISLKRNVGHQRAIAVGLSYVVTTGRSQRVVVMDGDGEDRPEDVSALLTALQEPNQIAVAERMRRSEGLGFAAFYHAYRLLFLVLVGERIRFGNFCAMGMDAARRLVQMNETWLNLPATIILSRLPLVKVPLNRGIRYHGTSKMNVVSLVTHGLSAVAVFMQRVLTRVMMASLLLVAFCAAAAVMALAIKFFGFATPGWLTTVVGILFIMLVSTGTVCLVGLFIGMTAASNPPPAPIDSYRALIASVASPSNDSAHSARAAE